MKKGNNKKIKTSIKRNMVLQIVLKGGRNSNFAWGNFDHSLLLSEANKCVQKG